MKRWTLVALGFLLACAQRVPDIDRTQPNKLQKSIFQDEWYYRQTVVDVPYGSAFSFIGETSRLERITWEITESFLTGYRSYEYVRDAELPYLLAGTKYQGAPIVQFKITSHFDVQRQYNPATGEQNNVIEENTTDRPWNERKYFRVDWSQNLLTNFDFAVGSVSGGALSLTPTAYYINDPTDPDHWFLGVRDPSTNGWRDVRDDNVMATLPSADYLDVVTKIFVKPQMIDYYGNGAMMVPACFLLSFSGEADCALSDVKVRHSFMKLPARNDYEPLEYPDNYVLRDTNGLPIPDANGNLQYIPMFDKFGFFRVERDRYDNDRGLTETGRINLINRWNLWQRTTFDDGTKVPFSQREVKPIGYYLSPGFPADLKPAANALVTDWNGPLADVVSQLTQGRLQNATVFTLSDNSYSVASDGTILNPGQQIGDLRYSYIALVNQPQSGSPLGYGPSAADPVTGEIISSAAYIYGGALDTYVQFAADVVNLLNGDITTTDLLTGEITAEQISASLQNRGYKAQVQSPGALQAMLPQSTRDRVQAVRAMGKNALLADPNAAESRLHAIDSHPELIGKLLNQDVISMLRADPTDTSPPTGAEIAQFSPSQWLTKSAMDREQKRLDVLSKNCIYMADFADDAILGLARQLKQQGGTQANLKATIRAAVFQGVAAHEVGHTLGLRHNFEGSFDALNFQRDFWNLKGTAATPYDTSQTDAQINGKMREFQYSSIMDYGSRFNSDIHGIGRYDKAAIRFGYGQIIEAFKNPLSINSSNRRLLFLGGLTPDFFRRFINYTQIPAFFGGIDNFDQRVLVDYQTNLSNHHYVEVPYLFCSDEYAGGTPSCDRWDMGMDAHEITVNAADSYERYYYFNSFKRDRRYFSPTGYMSRVFTRYFRPIQAQYQQWVYRQFVDGPLWQSLGDAQACYDAHKTTAGTDCSDYHSAADWATIQGFFNLAPDESLGLVDNRDWTLDVNAGGPFSAATMEGLNEFFAVMQRPEPGVFIDMNDFSGDLAYQQKNELEVVTDDWTALPACQPGQSSVTPAGFTKCSKMTLTLGDGRYPYTNYDTSSGYYYFLRVAWIGAFYDKVLGILSLTDPATSFIGVDTNSDIRRFAIGYNLMFPDLVHRLFTSIVAGNLADYAPYGNENGLVARPPFSATSTATDLTTPAQSCSDPTCRPIDVSNNFTVQLYTLLYGMAYFPASFNPEFLESSQICVKGNGECNIPETQPCDPVLPSGATGATAGTGSCVEFTSVTNGFTYRAVKTPSLGQVGLGPQLLQQAADQTAAYTAALGVTGSTGKTQTDFQKQTLENTIENVEMVRGFYNLFGYLR